MRLNDFFGSKIQEHIVKVKGGYRLVSKHGSKNLGTYPTRSGAEKREHQVQYFKHAGESVNEAAHLERAWELDLFMNMGNGYWVGSMLHDDGDSRKSSYELYHTDDAVAAANPKANQMSNVWQSLGFLDVSGYRATPDDIKTAAMKLIKSKGTTTTEGFKNTYEVNDRVDTPMGAGTIVAVSPNINMDGKIRVKLDDPSRAGEDGKTKDTFVLTTQQVKHLSNESDISGILAASNLNNSFVITARTAEGDTKKYRVQAQSERVAREKFAKHYAMAKILDVKAEA